MDLTPENNEEELENNNQFENEDSDEVEKTLIASLFNQTKFIAGVATRLNPSDFNNSLYRAIFLEIVTLYNENEKIITPSLVKERLKCNTTSHTDQEYRFAFNELGYSVPCTSSEEFNKLIDVKKCQSIQQALNQFGQNTLAGLTLSTKNIESVLNNLNANFFSITSSWVTNTNDKDAKTLNQEFEKELNERLNNNSNSALDDRFNSIKYNWCLRSVYDVLDGFNKQLLYILAARPGMGKTTLALNWAVAMAKIAYEKNKMLNDENTKKHRVLFFSLEMSANQMFEKVISLVTYIDNFKIKHKSMDQKDLAKYRFACQNEHLSELPLLFFDDGSLTLSKIESIVKEYSAKYIVDLVVIDYLQLIKLGNEYYRNNLNRTNEVAVISKTLKTMALNLEVPIVALSQLSRRVETNGENKKPLLSDLRESGSIEQDADVVMFLYIDDEAKNIVIGEENKETFGITWTVEKNRFGITTTKQMKFAKYCSRFEDATQWTDALRN